MKNARDQDMATGVISLSLLANKLAWFLSEAQTNLPSLKKDKNIFGQWERVLKETIDFIQTPEPDTTYSQIGVSPRFLSRAQYLEQIYTATPDNINKSNLKEFAVYLREICDDIEKLSKDQHLNNVKKRNLSAFAESVAKESINEASRFYQEIHVRDTSKPPAGMTSSA